MNTVLQEAFNFFRTNIYAISILTIRIELPFILVGNLDVLGTIPDIIDAWVVLVGLIFVVLVIPFSTGAQVSLYSQIIKAEALNLKKCITLSKNNLLYLVISSICFFLLLMGGLLLFIIPGIIIGSRLSFFPFFIMYEGYRPLPALRESFLVTKDYVWKIAAPIVIINLIVLAPAMIIMLIFQDTGVFSYFIWIILDLILSIIGWLSVIVAFRFYCMYKNETSLN